MGLSVISKKCFTVRIYDKKLELIQTDAAISVIQRPLLNKKEVIGINTLPKLVLERLSFAIPINKAKEIAYQLVNNGKVIHPMIGISLIDENSLKLIETLLELVM